MQHVLPGVTYDVGSTEHGTKAKSFPKSSHCLLTTGIGRIATELISRSGPCTWDDHSPPRSVPLASGSEFARSHGMLGRACALFWARRLSEVLGASSRGSGFGLSLCSVARRSQLPDGVVRAAAGVEQGGSVLLI